MTNENYILGYSEREIKRIAFQAAMLKPITTRMLHAVKITDGKIF